MKKFQVSVEIGAHKYGCVCKKNELEEAKQKLTKIWQQYRIGRIKEKSEQWRFYEVEDEYGPYDSQYHFMVESLMKETPPIFIKEFKEDEWLSL